jgi:phenylacetaldehyde dehydrogenase
VGKIAPALAAGCTVVLKPAEQTPLSAIRLGELIQEVGFPDGVVNIVTGTGESAGRPLVEHPDVDKIAFTGSTRVGKSILAAAGGTLKRVTLELGGKSPVFVFPDADLEAATTAAANGIFINTGQICAAGSRLFVHERVYDRVMEGVVARARSLKIGPGAEADTFMGPVVSSQQLQRVTGYVRAGQEQGAEIVSGEQALPEKGYFVRPTVLSNVRPEMSVMRDEIFGPVVCALRFGDEDLDAIARVANDTSYGLSAYIWTSNVSTAHKLASRIKAGSISVNGGAGMDFTMPFGGFKQSGLGREHGREGAEGYTETKTVSITL